MARDFYPFVEEGDDAGAASGDDRPLEAREAARIAVYDDASAAPRVVMVEAGEVRGYLEEITATVAKLAREQGGTIPFMVIREIVENFVHAYFRAPTITILDEGNTIRFSDRGPGIREKDRALEFGTSSATEEMKRYIRGVGSGLPYVQQYMEDKGGSLDIEDNLDGGTVVTISTRPREEARAVSGGRDAAGAAAAPAPAPGAPGFAATPTSWPAGMVAPTGAQVAGYPAWPAAQQAPAYAAPAQAGWGAPAQGMVPQQPWAPVGGAAPAAQPYAPAPAVPQAAIPQAAAEVAYTLDDRARQALSYLAERAEAGPTDLVRAFGSSAATWSRALSSMAAQGLVTKVGQKYHLTGIGRTLA
ncbi:ATP-binding protein [Thermophilibacter sp.]